MRLVCINLLIFRLTLMQFPAPDISRSAGFEYFLGESRIIALSPVAVRRDNE